MDDENSSAAVTLDPYDGWNTAGIGGANAQTVDWSAGAVTPGAQDWGDVLRNGFGRLVDAKVNKIVPQNAAPVLAKTGAAPSAQGPAPAGLAGMLSGRTGLIVGAVVVGAALIFLMKRSG